MVKHSCGVNPKTGFNPSADISQNAETSDGSNGNHCDSVSLPIILTKNKI